MADLLLDSLEVHNFRAFRHLRIERLSRVNLFVGKNNVGKTSLLEALWLYTSRGNPRVIWEILGQRGESKEPTYRQADMSIQDRLEAISYLFHGWPHIDTIPAKAPNTIEMGSNRVPLETIGLSVAWYRQRYDPSQPVSPLEPLPPEQYTNYPSPIPVLVRAIGDQPPILHRLDEALSFYRTVKPIPHVYLGTFALSDLELRRLWNDALLAGSREQISDALKIIAPHVKEVELVIESNSSSSASRDPQRVMVKQKDSERFVPLGSWGEGMKRLFVIALGLVNARTGLLMIDEIENGLHYSILPDVWRFIFDLSEQLNVQIFATTHSWDCIKAFQEVATADEEVEGLLFNLREKYGAPGEIVAVPYDERRLTIATEQGIEVR